MMTEVREHPPLISPLSVPCLGRRGTGNRLDSATAGVCYGAIFRTIASCVG
jgi:hypothetical protein